MLYLLAKGNHVDLSYQGGQRPIVHLEADLGRVVRWADSEGRNWAFSDGNAGAGYTQFFNHVDRLSVLDWEAIHATQWKDSIVRERKQAEFLVEHSFPWDLVERIGVIDKTTADSVTEVLSGARHRPEIVVAQSWYY
jgi:hypothetical protein